MSIGTRATLLRGLRFAAFAIGVALAAGSCGATGSSPASPSGLPTMFGVVPDAMLIGVGDRGGVFAQAASDPFLPQDVTASTRWVSSNPAVASVQGSRVFALSAGEADLRASYQTLAGTTHVRVFPPSAVRQLVLYGTSTTFSVPCAPRDTGSFGVDAVLDTGERAAVTAVSWRSLDTRIASVTTVEQYELNTGVFETSANVTCATAGSTRVEATYAGRTVGFDLTVKAADAQR